MSVQPQPNISEQEYLEGEEMSPVKHEYRQGAAYAMAGASAAHGTIVVNLAALIRTHLRGHPCRIYTSDMKCRIQAADAFYYPDLLVTCDERDLREEYVMSQPCLVVEVLSPSTEAFDRGLKFADYRQLASLQEYLLVSQEKVSVDYYRRQGGDQWLFDPHGVGREIHLKSIDFRCPVDALYEDVNLGIA